MSLLLVLAVHFCIEECARSDWMKMILEFLIRIFILDSHNYYYLIRFCVESVQWLHFCTCSWWWGAWLLIRFDFAQRFNTMHQKWYWKGGGKPEEEEEWVYSLSCRDRLKSMVGWVENNKRMEDIILCALRICPPFRHGNRSLWRIRAED